MFCNTCGKEVNDQVAFCSACGTSVSKSGIANIPPLQNQKKVAESWHWGMILLWSLLTIVMPPFGVIMGCIHAKHKSRIWVSIVLIVLGITLTITYCHCTREIGYEIRKIIYDIQGR